MINQMKQSYITSTTLFNQAYDEANAVYKDEVRIARGKTKETRLAKLMWAMRFEFQRVVPRLVANIAYEHGNDFTKLREQLNVVNTLHEFNQSAQLKMQSRMSWSSYMDLPLAKIMQGDTERTVDDVAKLRDVLSDNEDYMRFVVQNSSLYARDIMKPLNEVASDCKTTWADMQEVVRDRALLRLNTGKGSKTDKIICRKVELTTYMIPFVASRYLKVVLASSDYTQRQIEYSQDACDKAVREAIGQDADSRTRKVEGYDDMSHSEKEGYCDPAQAEAIRQRYDDGSDELGIIGLNELRERLDDLALIESTLIDVIQSAIKACKDNKLDLPAWGYTWTQDGHPIQDREVALKLRAEYIASKRAEREQNHMQQRDDEGRYFAQSVKVPTFELEFGYNA